MVKKVKPKAIWKKQAKNKWRLWCRWSEHYSSNGIVAMKIPSSETPTFVTIQTIFGFELYIPPGNVCGVPRTWLIKELDLYPQWDEIWTLKSKSPQLVAKWKKKIVSAINKYYK